MGRRVGQGRAGLGWAWYEDVQNSVEKGVVTNNYNEGRDDECDCDLDPWGSETCRSIPVFFTVPKRCPPTFAVFNQVHKQSRSHPKLGWTQLARIPGLLLCLQPPVNLTPGTGVAWKLQGPCPPRVTNHQGSLLNGDSRDDFIWGKEGNVEERWREREP